MTNRIRDNQPAPIQPPRAGGHFFITACAPDGTLYSRSIVRIHDFGVWVTPVEIDRAKRKGIE